MIKDSSRCLCIAVDTNNNVTLNGNGATTAGTGSETTLAAVIVDKENKVYVIEVNPRSSRTVPFLSKATGYPLADIGTLAMLGKSLKV